MTTLARFNITLCKSDIAVAPSSVSASLCLPRHIVEILFPSGSPTVLIITAVMKFQFIHNYQRPWVPVRYRKKVDHSVPSSHAWPNTCDLFTMAGIIVDMCILCRVQSEPVHTGADWGISCQTKCSWYRRNVDEEQELFSYVALFLFHASSSNYTHQQTFEHVVVVITWNCYKYL